MDLEDGEGEDEFAPDKNPTHTTAAEDQALLDACNQETEGEEAMSGKEKKMHEHFVEEKAAVKEVSQQI
jgi:hypothetical protein